MRRALVILAILGGVALSGAAYAAAPPPNALPLSQILQMQEQSGNVAYFDEIEWDDDGFWEIEYVAKQGGKVKLRIDPVTGQVRK